MSKFKLASSGSAKGKPSKSESLPPRTKNGTPARPQSRDRPYSNLRAMQKYDDTLEEEDEATEDLLNFRESTDTNGAAPWSSPGSRPSGKRSTRAVEQSPRHQLPRKGDPAIASKTLRQVFTNVEPAMLTEADIVILRTENAMRQLQEQCSALIEDLDLQRATSNCAQELLHTWRDAALLEGRQDKSGEDSSSLRTPFQKANYIGSLLLAMYHPPTQAAAEPRSRDNNNMSTALTSTDLALVPLTQILLDWLDTFHTSYHPLLAAVQSTQPNCTAHKLYWDIIQTLVLRGKIREVMLLFEESDFKYAVSALDDGSSRPGYSGAQLQAVQGIVGRAHQVLGSCPGVRDANWDTNDEDWDQFRYNVTMELQHLEDLAEDTANDHQFEAENFGIRKAKRGVLSKSLQTQTSRLPPSILDSLMSVYSILLGSAEDILAQSQDWLEAATAMTIWRNDDDEDENIAAWSRDVSRSHGMTADDNLFLRRLRAAFLCVTDPNTADSFPISNTSSSELGVAAVFQGDLDGALLVCRSLSLCVTSSLAEIGSLAGWLSSPASAPNGFDEDDLIVLNYNAQSKDVDKDDLLILYSESLFNRDGFHVDDGPNVEGWEAALSVASRITDDEKARSTIGGYISALQLEDQERMNKLVSICRSLGLEDEARRVSEKYADHLVKSSTSYGIALLYFARSHNAVKVRQLVDVLNSFCLVQSHAYPAQENLDDELKQFLDRPKEAFQALGNADAEAAEILRFHFAGYACIRRFYQLRDEGLVSTKSSLTTQRPSRPLARRRLALKTLIAAISSAADSIYGGLYDAERQSSVQVDCLLPLLGEATAFIAEPNKTSNSAILTSEQMYTLLAAIEDLSTVNSRVFDASEECLQASLRNFHGSLPPSPRDMLKKSMSSGTTTTGASNFSFSMMGSEMLAKSAESAGGKSLGSMVLVDGPKGRDAQRGWDWRARFAGKDKEEGVTGHDVIRYLRIGIAKELSVCMLDEDDGGIA